MRLLIPGGAGYIGSHMVKYAQEQGHDVVVLDDFSTGHEWAVEDCEIIRVNLLDKTSLSSCLKGQRFDGVIHFAAKSIVGDSIQKPDIYYQNNVVGTLNLINEMLRNDINYLVFSSSAAIYGNPVTKYIAEDHPKEPINPYGKSKLMVESILQDICSAYDFNVCCLRYFNAAGAHDSGTIGEAHSPETHLIPNILKASISGSTLKVFGNDYDTLDGTCIRDYVHVTDLSKAHFLALNYMKKHSGFHGFNLGNGDGFSILQVIEHCAYVMNKFIPYEINSPRDGDPARLVADSSRAISQLGWKPEFYNLRSIIKSSLKWHKYS